MIDALRRAAIAVTVQAEGVIRDKVARGALRAVAVVGAPGANVARRVDGMQRGADLHAVETASWVSSDAIMAGQGGPFDAGDLRHWLALAERAGVPFVPAQEILTLTPEEMDAVSGVAELPQGPLRQRAERAARRIDSAIGDPDDRAAPESPVARVARLAAIGERLHAALDAVPEGWMVRSSRGGCAELKSLAGMGAAGPDAPTVRFGPEVEIGPGWVRSGNRRRVHANDTRTVRMAAEGPDGGGATFLARPWVEAARWFTAEDPHRHGTPFAGKGVWPVEWRAFVERGRVIGVSAYYCWGPEPGPREARAALEVRSLAQAIASEAVATRAYPRQMEVEFVRAGRVDPEAQALLAPFGREDVACTLDFIEVANGGFMLLEGGPAHTPFGGGVAAGFTGCGDGPRLGKRGAAIDGVAFRAMAHVHLAEPSTWTEGDRSGRILTWDAVDELARD